MRSSRRFLRFVYLREHSPAVLDVARAGVRHPQHPRGPGEQGYTEVLFQVGYRPGNDGRGQFELARRAGKSSLTPDTVPAPLVFRHRLSTRLWHWVNALAMCVLLMSGLMIFNVHPSLYWGQYGANSDTPLLRIGTTGSGADATGFLQLGSRQYDTTGLLGRWEDANGVSRSRAFPYWATIPSTYNLALARRWHLFFAWVLVLSSGAYLGWSLLNGHIRRDLAPRLRELSPGHIWHDIKQHARPRFPTGDAALQYNILQKLAYVSVLFLMVPLIVLTGMTMSPGLNAA